MSDGGKGSSPRPLSVPINEFDDNWNRIFKQDDNIQQTHIDEVVQAQPSVESPTCTI